MKNIWKTFSLGLTLLIQWVILELQIESVPFNLKINQKYTIPRAYTHSFERSHPPVLQILNPKSSRIQTETFM